MYNFDNGIVVGALRAETLGAQDLLDAGTIAPPLEALHHVGAPFIAKNYHTNKTKTDRK